MSALAHKRHYLGWDAHVGLGNSYLQGQVKSYESCRDAHKISIAFQGNPTPNCNVNCAHGQGQVSREEKKAIHVMILINLAM